LEEQIDENGRVDSMRSFMILGFPLNVRKDFQDKKSEVVRYKNLLDKKLDQVNFVSEF